MTKKLKNTLATHKEQSETAQAEVAPADTVETANSESGAVERRAVLKAALGATVIGSTLASTGAAAEKPPEKMRPQPGDLLVHRFGDREGQPVMPADIPSGAELLQASAKDAASGVMRDGSRLNGINVVQLNPDDLDEETAPFAVEGVVAYSSVCTHQGCDLTQWLPDTRTFKCYCHYSEFDASKLGQPMHGPATRKLAILPLELAPEGHYMVADKFKGKVGFKKA